MIKNPRAWHFSVISIVSVLVTLNNFYQILHAENTISLFYPDSLIAKLLGSHTRITEVLNSIKGVYYNSFSLEKVVYSKYLTYPIMSYRLIPSTHVFSLIVEAMTRLC